MCWGHCGDEPERNEVKEVRVNPPTRRILLLNGSIQFLNGIMQLAQCTSHRTDHLEYSQFLWVLNPFDIWFAEFIALFVLYTYKTRPTEGIQIYLVVCTTLLFKNRFSKYIYYFCANDILQYIKINYYILFNLYACLIVVIGINYLFTRPSLL